MNNQEVTKEIELMDIDWSNMSEVMQNLNKSITDFTQFLTEAFTSDTQNAPQSFKTLRNLVLSLSLQYCDTVVPFNIDLFTEMDDKFNHFEGFKSEAAFLQHTSFLFDEFTELKSKVESSVEQHKTIRTNFQGCQNYATKLLADYISQKEAEASNEITRAYLLEIMQTLCKSLETKVCPAIGLFIKNLERLLMILKFFQQALSNMATKSDDTQKQPGPRLRFNAIKKNHSLIQGHCQELITYFELCQSSISALEDFDLPRFDESEIESKIQEFTKSESPSTIECSTDDDQQ